MGDEHESRPAAAELLDRSQCSRDAGVIGDPHWHADRCRRERHVKIGPQEDAPPRDVEVIDGSQRIRHVPAHPTGRGRASRKRVFIFGIDSHVAAVLLHVRWQEPRVRPGDPSSRGLDDSETEEGP